MPEQNFSINGDDKTLTMEMPEDIRWQYQLSDGAGSVLSEQTLEESTCTLQFGENSPIALPQDGESYHLRTRVYRQEANLLIFGKQTEAFEITRESLQFRKLNPRLTMASKNTVQITWDETRGDHYEVQSFHTETGSWEVLSPVNRDQERSFLDLVEPGQTKQYRVVALDEQGNSLQESEEMTVTGRERVQYATVWPVKDLAAYSESSMGQVIGTAKVGKAYCVLEEVDGMFAVRIDDRIGYISSNYCMINLPEYIGGLCSYNITNSYYSIYAIHEFSIEKVTGVITRGYENIYQDDGSFLVPLLYPAAKRLLTAAKSAWDQGYRLKIYDSFRPHAATIEIYDLTSQIMADPLPSHTQGGAGAAQPQTRLGLPEPGLADDRHQFRAEQFPGQRRLHAQSGHRSGPDPGKAGHRGRTSYAVLHA